MENKKKKLSRKELFRRVEAVSSVFWDEDAEPVKALLNNLLKAHRPSEIENQEEWFTFILQLVMLCPPLLENPPGFEWVMRDFKQIFILRRAHENYNHIFWNAFDNVRGTIRKGRPSNKDQDNYRYMMVGYLVKQKGLSKTKAVKKWAEEEANSAERKKNSDNVTTKQREIWKSLEKVKQNHLKQTAVFEKWLAEI